MKPRIILAGGSGFIGQSLASSLLERGDEIVVLTRTPSHQEGAIRHVQWDGRTAGNWIEILNGSLALVNLTGRSINCRHTPENRREIIDSRVNSVRVLGEAITRCAEPPKVFVQAAGVGIYGDQGDRWCDETAPHGHDFVAQVCEQWEGAFEKIDGSQTRKVLLRLGVAIGPGGGFLKVLGRLTKAFLGGHVGNGRQFISWIHIADLTRIILSAIERDDLTGVFNATSPNPVTNAEFMRELRRALHRPWSPPVPAFAARIGAWLIGTEGKLALVSQHCVPKRLTESAFRFEFPALRLALANIYPTS
jgi:uncharacterized protein (TIGR01777 family)